MPTHLYTMPDQGELFCQVIGNGTEQQVNFAYANISYSFDSRTGTVKKWEAILLWGVHRYTRIGSGDGWSNRSEWHPYALEEKDLPGAPRERDVLVEKTPQPGKSEAAVASAVAAPRPRGAAGAQPTR